MRPLLLAVLALAGMLSIAWAHDQYGRPNWLADGHYTSPIDGTHCCGVNDCTVLDPDDVSEVKGGYSLRGLVTYGAGKGAINQWLNETVPMAEVQTSRDGQYWRCHKPDLSRRCFFAPPPSQ